MTDATDPVNDLLIRYLAAQYGITAHWAEFDDSTYVSVYRQGGCDTCYGAYDTEMSFCIRYGDEETKGVPYQANTLRIEGDPLSFLAKMIRWEDGA